MFKIFDFTFVQHCHLTKSVKTVETFSSDDHVLSFTIQVKSAYVHFLNHCYVDTEVEMKEIYSSSHIWTLFEDFMVDMGKVCILVI